jgi:RNA polymerase sigma-70 factor (ECF subfamily)
MATGQENDSELVKRLRTGDRSAFAALYTRYKDQVYDYSYRLSMDPAAAEDAVQETFLRMREAIDTLADTQAFRAWLFSIARNLIFNSLRRPIPRSIPEEEDLFDSNDPWQDLIREDNRRNLTSVFARLKPAYRELLILREYEDLSYAEIAATLALSVGSVKVGIYRARKALAQLYGSQFKEGRRW